MGTLGNTIRLVDRDYEILQDIYEFYYMDFHAARLRYWKDSDHKHSRTLFNKRMLQLVREELVAPVPFFSFRRKGNMGSSDYAYTLTNKGVRLLSDLMDTDIEWDTTRKDRKNIYIQHHVNVLYYVLLYDRLIESEELEAYYGEQSSRFQQQNKDNILKDYIKPDAMMFFRLSSYALPWIIEYERNSRASRQTILTKLGNHSQYAMSGGYQNHPIMKEFDHTLKPVFLLYCEDLKVLQRRVQLINLNKISFHDSKLNGYSEILFAVQDEVEQDPYGAVYYRPPLLEKVTLSHVNNVQLLAKSFSDARIDSFPDSITYSWYAAHLASRQNTSLDGIVWMRNDNSDGAFIIRYYEDGTDAAVISKELNQLVINQEEKKWEQYPIINRCLKGNVPTLLLIVDTPVQEEQLINQLVQLNMKERFNWNCRVSRFELVTADPYGDHWRAVDESDRIRPL